MLALSMRVIAVISIGEHLITDTCTKATRISICVGGGAVFEVNCFSLQQLVRVIVGCAVILMAPGISVGQTIPQSRTYEQLLIHMQSMQAQIDELSLHPVPHEAHAPAKTSEFPTATLEGLIQADLGYFSQNDVSRAAIGDLQDGGDFRRARIGVHGKAWHSTSYMIEMDYASLTRVAFTDVYVQLDGEYGNIRIGRWRQPFGMSALTSVKELPFIERASTFGFVPFRQSGVGASGTYADEMGTWALSGFRTESDLIGASLGDDGGWGLAGRATGLLLDDKQQNRLAHVGFNYSLIAPPDDSIRFASRPEAFLAEVGVSRIPAFIDTGSVSTELANLFAFEGAVQFGRFIGQAEYFIASMNQIGGPSLGFRGAYGQVIYALNGDPRPYNRKQGVFGRPKVDDAFDCGGSGAWELAARWSWMDLNDANISGGEMTTLTAGVNWHLNRRFKLQFNYINATHAGDDGSSDFFVTRAQVDF